MVPYAVSAGIQVYELESGSWVQYDRGGGVTPPPSNTILVGARVAPSNVTPAPLDTVSGVQALIGNLDIGRVYHNGGLPASYASTLADSGMNGMASTSGCIISTQTSNSNYNSYVLSLPDALLDEGRIYMTWHHEPEGDYATGAAFVAEYTTFRNAIKAIDPRVKVGPIASGVDYSRFPNSEAVAGNYLPGTSICDFYGIDLYHPMIAGTHDPIGEIGLGAHPDWAVWFPLISARGKPIIIPEWGIYAEPNQITAGTNATTGLPNPIPAPSATVEGYRAWTITEWVAEWRALTPAVEAFCYWMVNGKAGEPGTYNLQHDGFSDAGSIAALSAVKRYGT